MTPTKPFLNNSSGLHLQFGKEPARFQNFLRTRFVLVIQSHSPKLKGLNVDTHLEGKQCLCWPATSKHPSDGAPEMKPMLITGSGLGRSALVTRLRHVQAEAEKTEGLKKRWENQCGWRMRQRKKAIVYKIQLFYNWTVTVPERLVIALEQNKSTKS